MNEATILVEWEGETLTVTYRASGLTNEERTRLSARLSELSEQSNRLQGTFGNMAGFVEMTIMADIVEILVLKWDLTEDGKELPVTREVIDELPLDFLGTIVNTIIRHANPLGWHPTSAA